MENNPIEKLREDISEIKRILDRSQEVSLSTTYGSTMAKVFLLSCASFFEAEIKKILEEYVRNYSNDEKIVHLIKNKILSRDYHTLFNWKEGNINNFTGFFGSDFKERVDREMKNNEDFNKNTKAFLEIGKERNQLVHNNFASYDSPKTMDEIYELYNKAKDFPIKIKELLTERNDEQMK